ncbi:tRNA (cytidine(34)-2'-O)-methyltransferase [Parachitinimonas caeni]|uniref:tRNA (cytidine(34)-2'-O)-methyltransferase n=1 Tax=Parachitinimonas caeni TaxID=3031301 RepID=A0ABT7DX73_9NEIS|nr:tRNA (cytidine(34)-2'-O)-methyltransferase [Parachitinimonas caeni]MDK2124672.1 tRNA (cytidine(34)-2'-O)-methyltransferase [Parachitinimonas caeni]
MFDVVLFEPEIGPNCGNVIRLCANTGCRLHLIEPLGFNFDDKHLRRAGLDYHDLTLVNRHADFASFLQTVQPSRLFPCTTKGSRGPANLDWKTGDAVLFGPESRGLPQEILAQFPQADWLRLPMRPNNRSLNLSNAVAVTVYEGWRQLGYAGAG